MNKPIWTRILAYSVIVIVLSVTILPLMVNAEGIWENNGRWSEEAPDFSNYYTFNENNFQMDTIHYLVSGIQYAYGGGMFGGSIPIAIIASKEADASQYTFIDILTLTQQANPTQTSMGTKEEGREATTLTIVNNQETVTSLTFTTDNTTYPQAKIVKYRMCSNGDFVPITISTTISYSYMDNYPPFTSKIMAIRTGYIANQYNENTSPIPTEEYSTLYEMQGDWYISRGADGMKTEPNYFFMTAWGGGTPTTMTEWAEELREKYAYNGSSYQDGYLDGHHDGFDEGYYEGYDIGYEDGREADDPVVLDIAEIFTSMFQGVHSIFQGFNINIFGISIAGMLLGILLITVIAFIIKKIK